MGISDIFQVNQIKEENDRLKRELSGMQAENAGLRNQLSDIQKRYDDLYNTVSGKKLSDLQKEIAALSEQIESLNATKAKADDELQKTQLKAESLKTVIKAAQKAVKADAKNEPEAPDLIINTFSLFTHISEMHYNCLDVPALRKLFSANKSNIQKLTVKYEDRYTTKTNKALYQLMILGLEAELQNILLNLRFGTVDKAKEKVNSVTKRYYDITANGNRSIASTLKKFIDELTVYYMEAVNIEYECYTQRERIKEEQKAIKEQMRQEAEERRILQQHQKHIEKEEQKYLNEIENVKLSIAASTDEEIEKYKKRLAELESMLNAVEDKKEQIIKLQNGQAGNVYVISNIGSFGENVFKIGMTRRDDPQERIDELGNASVPFPFDVHSFIFSDNAVELETMLHRVLDNKRLNKVNKRKEFFNISLNELEKLVHKIQPAAEFKMTALAEQYNRSAQIPGGDIIYSEIKPLNATEQTATARESANTTSAPPQTTVQNNVAPDQITSENIIDKIKNIIKDYEYQEEAAPDFTRLHIYTGNRKKIGIIKIYKDDRIEIKRPGEPAQQIDSLYEINNIFT